MKNPEEQFSQPKLEEEPINFELGQEVPLLIDTSENILEKSDINSEKHEIQENQLLNHSKKVGSFYASYIENLTKTGEAKNEILEELPEDIRNKFKNYLECIEKNNQSQHVRFSLKKEGAKDLLQKIIKRKNLNKELVEDQSKYELEEMSPGNFVIHMDKDLYSKLCGEAVACASIDVNDISFIALPKEYKEYTDERAIKGIYEQNLKHETHHIAWSFLLKDHLVKIKESDNNVWLAYRMFQDEIIARLTSGGGHMGYTHLYLAEVGNSKIPAGLTPEIEQQIKQKTLDLNIIMQEDIVPFLYEAELCSQDLIYSVMQAENFDELENNLKKIQAVVEKKAKENRKLKPQIEINGWSTVNV